MARHMKWRKRNLLPLTILAGVLIMIGTGLIAYPHLFGWLNAQHQRDDVEAYQEALERMDEAAIEEHLTRARDYNEHKPAADRGSLLVETGTGAYSGLLDPSGTGMMGYVDIDRIDVHVPLYHGISDTVLKSGAGHVPKTSLPVGGPSTHAAISAHRGEPGADYFRNLDQLEVGDGFSVTVLGRRLDYEVDQILVVEPDDASALAVEEGADYLTLVTCTPYGVNSHRLLVRGHRVG